MVGQTLFSGTRGNILLFAQNELVLPNVDGLFQFVVPSSIVHIIQVGKSLIPDPSKAFLFSFHPTHFYLYTDANTHNHLVSLPNMVGVFQFFAPNSTKHTIWVRKSPGALPKQAFSFSFHHPHDLMLFWNRIHMQSKDVCNASGSASFAGVVYDTLKIHKIIGRPRGKNAFGHTRSRDLPTSPFIPHVWPTFFFYAQTFQIFI